MTSTELLRAARAARAALLAAALVVVPASVHAQARSAQDIESARSLFIEGVELRDRGDLKGALEKLRAAHALGNTPITGIELCRTHAALRQPVEAREVCLGVGRIPQNAQETARSQAARAEAPRIAEAERAKIATLRLRLNLGAVGPGHVPSVTVDDTVVPAAALNQPRSVDPGAHVVVAKADGPEARATVSVKEGETLDVDLVVPAPTVLASPPPPIATAYPPSADSSVAEPRGSYALPITLFALGGVALVAGVATGLKASSDKNDLDGRCTDKQCGRELHDELSSAKTWGNVSTGTFIAGGVLAAGGVIALLVESSRAKRARVMPSVGLGTVGLHGSF